MKEPQKRVSSYCGRQERVKSMSCKQLQKVLAGDSVEPDLSLKWYFTQINITPSLFLVQKKKSEARNIHVLVLFAVQFYKYLITLFYVFLADSSRKIS